MESRADKKVPAGVFVGIAVVAAAWLALVLGLVTIVPRYRGMFADFGLKLPALTEMTFSAADLAAQFWPLAFGGVLLLLAVAAGAVLALYRQRPSRSLAYLLLAVLLIVPLVSGGCTAVSLLLPMIKLQQGLSR